MKKIDVSLNVDGEGFISQECPSCKRRFKIQVDDGQERPIRFCPYCDHSGEGCWWTPEQADYLTALAAAHVVAPEIEEMARDFNRRTSGNQVLRMKMSIEKPRVPNPPSESDDGLEIQKFSCCGVLIKHDGQNVDLFCVLCGTDTTQS